MTYQNLFLSRYPDLSGKDWVRHIDPDDLQVFVDIGLKANQHGKLGGKAIVQQKGREYMAKIGRIGAIAANSKREWLKAIKAANEAELGVTFDY